MAAAAKELTAEIPIEFKFMGVIDKTSGKIDSITKITGGKIGATDIVPDTTDSVTSKEVIAATGIAAPPAAATTALPGAGFGSDKTITDLNAAVMAYTDAIEAARKESERKADAASTDAVLAKDATQATVDPLIAEANAEKMKVDTAVTAVNTAAGLITDPVEQQKAKDDVIKPIIENIAIQDGILAAVVVPTTGGARHRQSRKSKKAGGKKRRKSQRRRHSKN